MPVKMCNSCNKAFRQPVPIKPKDLPSGVPSTVGGRWPPIFRWNAANAKGPCMIKYSQEISSAKENSGLLN